MCFELDSLPPIPAISGAAVSHEDLVLEAADGNSFAAFAATPDEPTGAGVVVLPDVRGLYRFYEELALRFAERGVAAIAIDYFGRTADDVGALEEALEEAGVEHEVVTYEGAPHSFFDRRHEEFADASDDAWQRVLAFVERHG